MAATLRARWSSLTEQFKLEHYIRDTQLPRAIARELAR
jgi:hypothetical protein